MRKAEPWLGAVLSGPDLVRFAWLTLWARRHGLHDRSRLLAVFQAEMDNPARRDPLTECEEREFPCLDTGASSH